MSEQPPPPAPPPAPRHPDRLAAVVSGFVAALALAVSSYNVYLQRQQIRAQVWPRLQWSFSNVGGFAYNLQNCGVGPAEVHSACMLVDDQPVSDWDEALRKLLERGPGAPEQLDQKIVTSWVTGKVFTPGEVLHPLEIRDPVVAALLNAQKARLRVQLCYCSTLDECWRVEGYGLPEPVDRCKPCPRPFKG
jgi:hypothetical protein